MESNQQVVLSDDQIERIVAAVKHHACRFEDEEAKTIHRFAQTMDKGGWEKFSAVLDFGATLIQARKAGVVAMVGAFVVGVLGVIWLGLKTKLGTP